jgi:putative ABC transport system substrate-binding protein
VPDSPGYGPGAGAGRRGFGMAERCRMTRSLSMHRRKLLIAAAAWPALAWAGAVFAQSKQAPILIGWLSLSSRESGAHSLAALKEGLAALGWKEGSQIIFEERWGDGRADRLPSLAKELAAKKPAVIVASGGRAAVDAAKGAPKITIVMAVGSDPVAIGLAASLARPGGMVTGVTGLSTDLTEKYLEILLAAAPKLRRVGFLAYSHNPDLAKVMEAARRSAAQYSVEARFAEVASPEEIEPAISRLAKEGTQALVVMPGALLQTERRRIAKLALAQRWPVVAGPRVFAEEGALLSYSADTLANHRRAAYYVDRILKGAKPGDLPIEQPTKFELVVNLRTAKAIGLSISQDLLFRADKVIE